jgi:hypothetical protein
MALDDTVLGGGLPDGFRLLSLEHGDDAATT